MNGETDAGKVLSRLRNLCSKRECCAADIRAKALTALDGDGGAADAVVESLLADGYVDDRRYCAAYAREKSSIAGWGGMKIRHALSQKGVSREDIDSGLAEIDGNMASARLERLLTVKRKSLGDDPRWRMKLLRFALGRGYGYDEAHRVMEKLAGDGAAEDY